MYCVLPEEDVGRVRQILVDENGWGRMTHHRNQPQLLEVVSELGNELRCFPGGG
jgi:hypothetical protein